MAARCPEDGMRIESIAEKNTDLTDEGNGIYSQHQRSTLLLNSACRCFKEGLYTDVTVVVGESRFDTHRLVLVSISDFFPPLLKMDQSNTGEVILNEIEAEDFATILRFAYTGEVHLTTHNVQGVLMAADYLSVTGVSRACEKFMAKNLEIDNVCSVISFATNYSLKFLKEKSIDFFCNNLDSLSKTSDFLTLDFNFLLEMFDDDNLVLYKGGILQSMEREELILCSVLRYLSQTPPPSSEVIEGLIRCVRLPQLKEDILKKNMKKFKDLKKNEIIRSYLKKSEIASKCIGKDSSDSEWKDAGIPHMWMRKRKLAAFKIHDGKRQYAAGGQVGRCNGPPQKFHTDPDLEIAEVHVWIRIWYDHPVIGGLLVKYRRVGEEEEEIIKEYSKGTVNQNSWKRYSAVLQKGEYIISATVGHGHLLDALTFDTDLGYTTVRMGGAGGNSIEEKAPKGSISYLHDINCMSVSATGEQAIYNLQFQWITFD